MKVLHCEEFDENSPNLSILDQLCNFLINDFWPPRSIQQIDSHKYSASLLWTIVVLVTVQIENLFWPAAIFSVKLEPGSSVIYNLINLFSNN